MVFIICSVLGRIADSSSFFCIMLFLQYVLLCVVWFMQEFFELCSTVGLCRWGIFSVLHLGSLGYCEASSEVVSLGHCVVLICAKCEEIWIFK